MARPTTRSGSRHLFARKVVPLELRRIVGKTELKAALRGATKAERDSEHRAAMERFDGQIQTARDTLAGNLRSLTAREAHALCRRWYVERLEAEEPGATAAGVEGWTTAYENLRDEAPGDNPFETYSPDKRQLQKARSFLAGEGIAADVQSVALMASALWQTELRLADTMRRRCAGDWGADEHLAGFPVQGSVGVAVAGAEGGQGQEAFTFAALVDAWAAERKPIQKTLEKWRAAFAGFAAVIGHDDARRVTVADVRIWKEERLKQGRATKTVIDGISVMRATVNWGIRNSLLAAPNPFANMAPAEDKSGEPPRDPYSEKDAVAILEAARRAKGWRRWLPWVLAFTGARISEIAGLRQEDIREQNGVWVIDIRPNAERKLKTRQSQRLVPVHPALEAEGFLKYAAATPSGALWPDLKPGRYGQRGSTATKEHSRWVRNAVKITDKRKAPAHSWRHRLEDELRRARPAVPEEAIDATLDTITPATPGQAMVKATEGCRTCWRWSWLRFRCPSAW